MSANKDKCQCSGRLYCVTKTKDRSSDYYTDVTEWRQSRAPARDTSQTHQFILPNNDRGQCMTRMQRRGGVRYRSARKFARFHWPPQAALSNGPSLHTEGIQRVKV